MLAQKKLRGTMKEGNMGIIRKEAQVPLPLTILLLGFCLIGLAGFRTKFISTTL
jgi:uncharacterized membrane protein (DUF485 family)